MTSESDKFIGNAVDRYESFWNEILQAMVFIESSINSFEKNIDDFFNKTKDKNFENNVLKIFQDSMQERDIEIKEKLAFYRGERIQTQTIENNPESSHTRSREEKFLYNGYASHIKKEILLKMSLIYFYTSLEGLIKDIMIFIFINNPNSMKSFNKSFNLSQILDNKSIDELHYLIADKIMNDLWYNDIDGVAKEFLKKFNIDFTNFVSWSNLREGYYRRNIFVHNQGKISEIYARKVNENKPELGTQLTLDFKYIESIGMACLGFAESFFKVILNKFAK